MAFTVRAELITEPEESLLPDGRVPVPEATREFSDLRKAIQYADKVIGRLTEPRMVVRVTDAGGRAKYGIERDSTGQIQRHALV